jgi:hypothetical protein
MQQMNNYTPNYIPEYLLNKALYFRTLYNGKNLYLTNILSGDMKELKGNKLPSATDVNNPIMPFIIVKPGTIPESAKVNSSKDLPKPTNPTVLSETIDNPKNYYQVYRATWINKAWTCDYTVPAYFIFDTISDYAPLVSETQQPDIEQDNNSTSAPNLNSNTTPTQEFYTSKVTPSPAPKNGTLPPKVTYSEIDIPPPSATLKMYMYNPNTNTKSTCTLKTTSINQNVTMSCVENFMPDVQPMDLFLDIILRPEQTIPYAKSQTPGMRMTEFQNTPGNIFSFYVIPIVFTAFLIIAFLFIFITTKSSGRTS